MDETGRNETVGFSLLTTENPLTVQHDDQEDAEAAEEQRRRQQELQAMMAYAFDDIGDENSTINSSFELSSRGDVLTSGHAGYEESSRQNSDIHLEEQFREAPFNSAEQLQVLYQVQDRQIKSLNAELNAIKEEKEKELTGLKRKILLMENEHNGTNIALKQCQDLLVEKKRDIDEHLREINNLKDTIDNLTLGKRNSDEEVVIWKTKYTELEQKMNLIDQGLYVPVSERQIRNKYEQEITELQQNLEQSQKNLEKAIKGKSIAENDLAEFKQKHELITMEKDEQVHNLYTQLENSKFQCHNLTDRIGSLEKEYQNLTSLLHNTTKELESSQFAGSAKTLQQELKRSLDDQKLKRDEIIKLEQQLEVQQNVEMDLRKKLNDFEEQYTTLFNHNQLIQADKESMSGQIVELNKHVDELTNGFKSKLEQLERECVKVKLENECLTQQLQDIKRENMNKISTEQQTDRRSSSYDAVQTNTELEMLKMQNEQLYKQLEETNKLKKDIELQSLKKIQELQTEMKPTTSDKKAQIIEEQCQKLKVQNEQLQKQCKDAETNSNMYRDQYDKYEKLCLELEKVCAEQKFQINEYHSIVTELEGKLLLKEKRDDLLDDLQQKARMFEQYIKNKSDVEMHNKSVNTDAEKELPEDTISKKNMELILKAQHDKFLAVANENKTLKEKIVFDRTALNELTEVWNQEINRLNTLVKELKREIDSKNAIMQKRQQTVTEEITQMSILINKLTETLRHKDKLIKECQEKEHTLKKQQEEIKQTIKTDYQQKETRLLSQFEQNMEEMKTRFRNEDVQIKSKFDRIQKKCTSGLEEINAKLTAQTKYNSEKFALETKIIEAYYDLLIQQAKLRKK